MPASAPVTTFRERPGGLRGDTMTSNRPYLVRALYEWILDNI